MAKDSDRHISCRGRTAAEVLARLEQRRAEQVKKRQEEEMIERVKKEVRLLFRRWGTQLPHEAQCDRGENPINRNGQREDDLADDLEQEAWRWLLGEAGQRMIANAEAASNPDAYMRKAIRRRLDRYICMRYRLGAKYEEHRHAVTFDSKLLDELVDAGADLPTHRTDPLSLVDHSYFELNDRLDRAPEGVRLYLCAFINDPRVTDKEIREAHSWTRTTFEKYRRQAYALLTEDLPDFRPATPPRKSAQPVAQPEPDAVAGADTFGHSFDEMRSCYEDLARRHPDCSVLFCSVDTGFVLWGRIAKEIGRDLSRDTSALGWVRAQTSADEDRMLAYLGDRDERLARGESLPPAWLAWDF